MSNTGKGLHSVSTFKFRFSCLYGVFLCLLRQQQAARHCVSARQSGRLSVNTYFA